MPAPHVPGWDSRHAVLVQTKPVRTLNGVQRTALARRMWAALDAARTTSYRESLVEDFDALLKTEAEGGTFRGLMAGLDALGTPE